MHRDADTRMPRTWLFALFAALLMLSRCPDAAAQSVHASIDALRSARGPRAHIRAMQEIVRAHPPGGREAIEEALDDRLPAVRRAAAINLGEFGDPAAIPALNARAADRDRTVQRAALASVRALSTLRTTTPAALAQTQPFGAAQGTSNNGVGAAVRQALAPAPVDWRQVRVVVSINSLANRPGGTPSETDALRAALRQAVEATPGFAVHPAGPLPAVAQQRLRARTMRWFSLEGSLASLQRQQDGTGIRVRAELSLAIVGEPAHNIIGTLSTAATAQEPPPPPQAPDPGPRLTRAALETVARGAVQRMQGQFLQAPTAPRRGRR